MRNSTKRSIHQPVALRAAAAALLIGATITGALGFNAAWRQSTQSANQQTPPPPRPAITTVSPEDAARDMLW